MEDNSRLYLENIEECIYDEDKIMTYKSLSRLLGVQVNEAKKMLYEFVEGRREQGRDLSVTYYVAGYPTLDDQVFTVQIVPEMMLESVKSSLERVVCCHVYSVQRNTLKSAALLFNTDYELVKNNILQSNAYSSVSCASSQPREVTELQRRKTEAQPTSARPVFTKMSHSKPPSTTKPISSMFGSQTKSETSRSTQATNKSTEATTKSTQATKKTPEATKHKDSTKKQDFFFSKQNNSTTSKQREKVDDRPREIKSEPDISPKETTESTKTPTSTNIIVTKVQTSQGQGDLTGQERSPDDKKKKRMKSVPAEGGDKKRRRVQTAAWEDSSSDEDPVPPTPPREMSPSPPPSPPPCPPAQEAPPSQAAEDQLTETKTTRRVKKRRKVTRQSLTEDGYMQTERVWEEYSTDASDTDLPPQPSRTQPSPPIQAQKKTANRTKVSPSKNSGKQTSLMSFFKKK